jgi:hypothetical protein
LCEPKYSKLSEVSFHLQTGKDKPENIVNEEQHILALVAELFGNGKPIMVDIVSKWVVWLQQTMYGIRKYDESITDLPRQSNTSTSPRRLIHLTKHQGDLRFAIKLDDASLLHLVVQIVTFTSTLADTSKD